MEAPKSPQPWKPTPELFSRMRQCTQEEADLHADLTRKMMAGEITADQVNQQMQQAYDRTDAKRTKQGLPSLTAPLET